MADLGVDLDEFPDAENTFICPWCQQPLWVGEADDGEYWYCDESDCYANKKDRKWDINGHPREMVEGG